MGRKSPLFWILLALVACAALTSTSRAFAPTPSGGGDKFPDSTVSCALALAGSLPNAPVVQFDTVWVTWDQNNKFASTGEDSKNGKYVYIFSGTFANSYPGLSFAGMDSGYACTLLALTLFHEALHHCYGIDNPGGKPANSCLHASIATATHKAACDLAKDYKDQIAELDELIDAETDPVKKKELLDQKKELLDKLTAACEVAGKIEKKWSKPKYAKKMAACSDGSAKKPFTPPPGCDGGYPPLPDPPSPTSSGYPDNEPFSCPNCDGVL